MLIFKCRFSGEHLDEQNNLSTRISKLIDKENVLKECIKDYVMSKNVFFSYSFYSFQCNFVQNDRQKAIRLPKHTHMFTAIKIRLQSLYTTV